MSRPSGSTTPLHTFGTPTHLMSSEVPVRFASSRGSPNNTNLDSMCSLPPINAASSSNVAALSGIPSILSLALLPNASIPLGLCSLNAATSAETQQGIKFQKLNTINTTEKIIVSSTNILESSTDLKHLYKLVYKLCFDEEAAEVAEVADQRWRLEFPLEFSIIHRYGVYGLNGTSRFEQVFNTNTWTKIMGELLFPRVLGKTPSQVTEDHTRADLGRGKRRKRDPYYLVDYCHIPSAEVQTTSSCGTMSGEVDTVKECDDSGKPHQISRLKLNNSKIQSKGKNN
ncbi:hypothetical protein B0H10DRAFT_1955176 [Mycena sp. CBHHK59/15]|nr:hypothetical protein B0H10DRAFT_1955176 [Mycena sp. CBHHK59/15]